MGPPEKEDGELAMEWGKMKACASRFEAIPEAEQKPIRGKQVVLQKQNKSAMLQKKKSKSAVKAAMKKKAMLKKQNKWAMKKKG